MENLLSIVPILGTDLSLVDFTFWIGFAAMLAAFAFLLSGNGNVINKTGFGLVVYNLDVSK
jgi:hypothetical protein